MVSLTSPIRASLHPHPISLFNSKVPKPAHRFLPRFGGRPRRFKLPLISRSSNATASSISNSVNQPPKQQPPRTLFPGGYKRPEIKVPNLVLQLSSKEVLEDKISVLDIVDVAVANQIGIVVLNGSGASGGKLYEAACLLKSVIRERAYLLIDERVDIAAAVNASGVLLSDQGLPPIVARNMMIDSKPESVFLPLVARNVQSTDAALDASKSEGADFLIYSVFGDGHFGELGSSVFEHVRVPTFVAIDSLGNEKSFNKISHMLKSGASGLVISLQELKAFGIDDLSKLYDGTFTSNKENDAKVQSFIEPNILDVNNGLPGKSVVAGFTTLEEREQQLIETERSLLLEAIDAIKRAAPLMEEVSLLMDAVSQLDDPFLLVIVGEFNSGKSTFINALLGKRYLKDGVVPTTNEITFLRYSEKDINEQQHCERHPDGEYVCYLPASILKEMIIVDTPGTNVILQRQQRLTEEFVPRADLVLFIMSADRPLSESEVTFLRYTQQWKKKVVFVLNKSDLYQNSSELEEAIAFVRENARKLLNVETVALYPVSARSALEAKLSASFDVLGKYDERLMINSDWKISSFYELEKYLHSFLDGTTSTGIERMKLKLGTPLTIAEQLLFSCQKLVRAEFQKAKQDLSSVDELLSSMEDYAWKMKSESISLVRQIMSQINAAQARVIKLVESTLRLSNLDIVASYVFKGEKSASMPVTSVVRNDIIDPALSEVNNLLGEYRAWLQSTTAHEGRTYKESFEKRWPSFADPFNRAQLVNNELLGELSESSVKVLGDFSAASASKLFEQEIREVFLGTFGGLGAAGLSASLLTSVLPSTLEDLLALGLCSAGGLLAISNFPARKQQVVDKVKRTADALARELEEAMQKDLAETIENLEKYVKFVAKPYQEKMQHRLDKLSGTLDELTVIENKLETLQMEIQNFHVS